ncbi:MAG: putative peptidoglycan binding domain, partial [Thermoleophilia bacterium]|nr:putative peptidoglycan binding domain [Thermoleophilia bacterium]
VAGGRITPAEVHAAFHFDSRLTTGLGYTYSPRSAPLVKEVQWRLQQFGVMSPTMRRTGHLDYATVQAVKRFQRAYRIPTLGTVGPQTRAALDAELVALTSGTAGLLDRAYGGRYLPY